jgi:hypothetical protein
MQLPVHLIPVAVEAEPIPKISMLALVDQV